MKPNFALGVTQMSWQFTASTTVGQSLPNRREIGGMAKLGVPRFSLPRHSPLDSTPASYSNFCRKCPKHAPISFDAKGAIAFDLPLDWPLL